MVKKKNGKDECAETVETQKLFANEGDRATLLYKINQFKPNRRILSLRTINEVKQAIGAFLRRSIVVMRC